MSSRLAAPEALIEAYVLDVMRRLPRKQRNDVGFELRALLAEGLRDRAADSGRASDEAMALELVRSFGQPDDVAARYHSPGVPIIASAHTRGFAWTTVIGVALQWAVSLPLALSGDLAPAVPESARLTAWWLNYGLGALWWPGFLITVMMVAAWIRRTWPESVTGWKPKSADREHINRTAYAIGLAASLCGIALWVTIAWSVVTFSNPFTRVLAFNDDFLATRAPVLLLYWGAGVALLVVLLIEGRWRELTRRIDIGLKIAACALMGWFVFGGRIFVGEPADQITKGALAIIILVILVDLALHAWRSRRRIRPPEAQRS